MSPIAVVDGIRTPFCKSGGAIKDIGADDLGAIVTRELLARTGIAPEAIDEVIFGCVCQPAKAANIARVIALKAGLPQSTIAQTVHRNCASGIQAVTTAALEIQAGRSDLIIAGGAESMSHVPLMFGPGMTGLFMSLAKAKTPGQKLAALTKFRPRFLNPIIGLKLGLTDPVCELNMGQTAEVLAREFGVTREEQDAFALESHQKAASAQNEGRHGDEVMPIVGQPRYDTVHEKDDGIRQSQTMEALAKLKPYFDRYAGTVTVGNACPVTDGAAALILCSEAKAKELEDSHGLKPIGWIHDWAYAALDGRRMGLGPVYAASKLLDQTGGSMRDYDMVELNEAFAAQVIANERAFASKQFAREHLGRDDAVGEIDHDKLNVNGGAIALGHPVGATGTRLILTMLREMKRRGAQKSLATLCVGGGQGAAVSLEAA